MEEKRFRDLNEEELEIVDKLVERGAISKEEGMILRDSLLTYIMQEPNHWTICIITTTDGIVQAGTSKCCWKDEQGMPRDADGDIIYSSVIGKTIAFRRAVMCYDVTAAPLYVEGVPQPTTKMEPKPPPIGIPSSL